MTPMDPVMTTPLHSTDNALAVHTTVWRARHRSHRFVIAIGGFGTVPSPLRPLRNTPLLPLITRHCKSLDGSANGGSLARPLLNLSLMEPR